uniref:Chemokine interleukin-8-like domain-containing protein n=1 Tax=Salvator merianae TaxID=96440 RepID=A0A8D0BEQ8_SALMN
MSSLLHDEAPVLFPRNLHPPLESACIKIRDASWSQGGRNKSLPRPPRLLHAGIPSLSPRTARMKTSPAALALLLAAAVFLSLCRPYCCLRYVEKPVPLRLLKSFHYTSSSCATPAVILLSKTGRKICADPEAPWVRHRIAKLPKD